MKRIPIFLSLILVALAVWIEISPSPFIDRWLNELETAAYDLQLSTKLLTRFKPLETSVVIVDIDDDSLEKIGRWPWSRAILSNLVDRIREGGAAVIAFDIMFSEKENNMAEIVMDKIDQTKLLPPQQVESLLKQIEPYFDNDKKFADSLKQIDSILAMSFVPREYIEGKIIPPLLKINEPLAFYIPGGVIGSVPILQEAAKSMGFINVFADEDGTIRRVPLLIEFQNGLYPSLALEAARLYLLANIELITAKYGEATRLEGVKMGKSIIPTDARSQVIIPFQGKSFTFPYLSAVNVINNKIPKDALNGKLVFIGTSATGFADLRPTSVASIFPGVEIQATVADGIIKSSFAYKPDWSLGAEIFLTVFFGLLFSLTFPYLGARILAVFIILIPSALILVNNWFWGKTGLIISILIPMILSILFAMINIIYGYFFETRRREQLKEMFGQYVPEKHIDEMLQTKSSYALLGEDREMTVLFADIRNFTTFSENFTASQIKELLNELFTPLTEIIFKYRGTIDKYIGDMIMAFWGAPLKDKKHAQKAITAALDMQKKVREINPNFTEKGWPEIHIGIGLNTGNMSVGDMGSKFRRNYTVLGDAVNLGSRVESLSKYYGVDIVTTEHTQTNQPLFIFRLLDRVKVKGKQEGISIYEVICKHSEITDELKNELSMSEAALNYYFNQQWMEARKLFTQLNTLKPNVKLYQLYLDRISEFEQHPPALDWNGIYIHIAK